MKIDWVRKLTSRKFWTAVASFVAGILLLNKVDADTTDKISGLILSFGSVVGYLFSEGLTDAAALKAAALNQLKEPTYGKLEDYEE